MSQISSKIAVLAFLGTISTHVDAALLNGSTLNFTASSNSSSIPANGSGSWFGVVPSQFGVIGISSLNGLIVGTTQTATGSHSGVPDGSESPAIDQPHDWYGNTGMLSTVSDTNIISSTSNTAELDFSGFRWSWGGTDNIVIESANEIATVTCSVDCGNGDFYTLDYTGYIEQGSPSGLGGEEVRIHLEGTISAVPVPAAIWLFSTGLISIVGLARRKRS